MRALVCTGISILVAIGSAVVACQPSGRPQPLDPAPLPAIGWEHPAPVKIADGGSCSASADCASGVCEGQGCGPGAGTCAPASRTCSGAAVARCGCDGATFQAPGECPGQRFEHAGACKRADGASCSSAGDCASGVCAGQGCGDDAPGVCVGNDQVCAMVVTEFCGCDGRTFTSATSCPGRRFASAGKCAPRPDGAACLDGAECASGVCEGQGCDAGAPGTCASARRPCTRDRRPYCGCDRKTFFGSGSCPGRRYAAKGECAAP